MGISDDVYLDDGEPEKDKFSLWHIGFAYDLTQYDRDDSNSPIVRRVAVFYGDLAKITPEQQQRWKTYEVARDGLTPHPAWWGSQMGRWPDGMGPGERLFYELKNISTLFEHVWRVPLFGTTERPDDFGWILRPSQREWDEFIVVLDKLLSDNLNHSALDAGGVPRKGPDGRDLGTLSRLAAFMEQNRVDPDRAKTVLRPLREVRQARQRPAHALRVNLTDQSFAGRQIGLMNSLNESLIQLRFWLASHPQNRAWKARFDEEESDYRF